jgi:flagellar M-ring protein FliF
MDFLNQAAGQMRELVLSMTPAARVTSVLLVGVIVVSCGYLFQHRSAGPDDYLFNGEFLPAADVDRAEAAIAQAGLTDYERVGNRLRVPSGQKAAYLAAVADAGALPPNFHAILVNALDVGAFVDPTTRQQRLKAAREQQLSMIIRNMHGIENAQVIYDMREPRGISRTPEVTATVSVEPTPGEALDPKRMKRIRDAVAGAIVGLTPDKVMVANLGDGTYLSEGGVSSESFDDPYFQHKIAFEQHMRSNIEGLLSYIPGLRVRVTAELDEMIAQTIRTTTPEGEATPLVESTQESETERNQKDVGGRPGTYVQGPNGGTEQSSSERVADTTRDTIRESENLVGTKDDDQTIAGMIPRRVRAGIAIPSDYLIDVWRKQQVRKGEDVSGPLPIDIDSRLESLKDTIVQDIEGAVTPLFPKELAKDTFADVSVTFFESITPDPIEPPSTADNALVWARQNFNTMTMAAIALVSLFMLRSMVKSIPASESMMELDTPSLSLHVGETENASNDERDQDEEQAKRPRLKLKKGHDLKDDLTDIVREDPDAAAAILRSWIGNAG